ncbi:protein KRI1 homolog [Oscarella lobularis]|uniref:protein KRI1 homolog n=1 Tax=Oscarella lobularis TaxID=121494 RepID=UPI003313B6F9
MHSVSIESPKRNRKRTFRSKMSDVGFRINAEYAKKYEEKKKKEELSRLRDKYGDNFEEESSSSESEDDDGRGITTKNDRDFLKTLSLLKSKDPRLFDKEFKLYESEDDESASVASGDEKKPMMLKDFEREQLLQKGSLAGIESDESDEEGYHGKDVLSYDEEQKQLKDNLKKSLLMAEEESKKEPLLKLRKKTEQEKRKEEDDYLEWLKGNQDVSVDEKLATDMSMLQSFWSNPLLEEDEKFLRDYILNKGYIDPDSDQIPTYDEIVAEHHDSEDEDAVEKQEEFERKYNFRFEEPGGTNLVSYPRAIPGSVRQEDDSRKKRRKEREERKEREKEEKQRELKRLKNLKKKEIVEKLEKIKEITGNENVGFDEDAFEGDFDAEKFDKMMEANFDEDYYAQEDEDEKPIFEKDDYIDDYGDWDEWEGPHAEDPDFNMDADYVASEASKPKRRNQFSSALERKKPKFDPNEKKFEDYFDEYYQLDYEDMIGDIPCRFKYRKVIANDFGLSADEMLKCEPKELNSWASLKRAVQYRTKEEEIRDLKKYRKKGKNAKAKQTILASLKTEEEVEEETTQKKQKKKGKKTSKEKTKKLEGVSEKRLKAYGITGKRKRKSKKKKKTTPA